VHQAELQEALAEATRVHQAELQEALAEATRVHQAELQEALAEATRVIPAMRPKRSKRQKEAEQNQSAKQKAPRKGQGARGAHQRSGDNLDNLIVISEGSDTSSDGEERSPQSPKVPWPEAVEPISENQMSRDITAIIQARTKKMINEHDLQGCGCEGECLVTTCSNIAMEYICDGNTCSVLQNGGDCANQLKVLDVESVTTNHKTIALAHEHGDCGPYGVVAKSYIFAGDDVIEYVGVVTEKPGEEYTMALSTQCSPPLFIDAEKRGNLSRFINHTCDRDLQNVEIKRRSYSGSWRIFLVATRDIAPGERVLVNYGETYVLECKCPAHDLKVDLKRENSTPSDPAKPKRMKTARRLEET
jgi:hypothetical protein